MRNKKHIKTDFLKFILEKYSKDGQELPDDEEIENPDEETEEPQLRKKSKYNKLNEFDDEMEDDEVQDEVDDELISELLSQYKRLKKKYENNKLHIRRRR